MKRLSAFIVFLVITASLFTLTACLTADEKYADFFASAEETFDIPGLSDDFVQQGICYIPSADKFAVCGYMTDGSASRIYFTDRTTSDYTYVTLKNVGGSDFKGHAGGIAYAGKYLWVANDSKCFKIDVRAALNTGNGESVVFEESVAVNNNASFVYAEDAYLWVGEFHYAKDGYVTEPSHKFTASGGEKNNAIVSVYRLDADGDFADSSAPEKILSVTDKIQGFAVSDSGKIVLSESYGRKNTSHIYVHKNVLESSPDTLLSVNGKEIPVWYLDKKSLEKTYECPPMTEDLEKVDGKIYIMFESASPKYVDTARFPQSKCIALTVA